MELLSWFLSWYIFHLYLWSCWPLGFFWTPPIIQAIANALDYLPEFDGKALLLKTLHTWVTEPKELKIVVFQKLHSSLLIFIVMEGAMYTTRENNHQSYPNVWTQWATIMTGQARHAHWYSGGMNIIGATKNFLNEFKAHAISWNLYLALISSSRFHV